MRALRMLIARLPNSMFKQIFQSFIHRGRRDGRSAEQAVEAHWANYAHYGGAQAFARQISSLDVRDTLLFAGKLSTLRIPARIVWGAADQFQKIEYGERLAHDLNAPLYRIEGGKHFTPEDYPDIIAAQTNQLISAAGR